MPDDPLTRRLAAIRERWNAIGPDSGAVFLCKPQQVGASAMDVPRLVAAVDAVLALADGSEEPAVDWGGVPLDPAVYVVRCDKIREAITRALTGEDGTDEH